MEDVTLKKTVFFTFYGIIDFIIGKKPCPFLGHLFKHFIKTFEYTDIGSKICMDQGS